MSVSRTPGISNLQLNYPIVPSAQRWFKWSVSKVVIGLEAVAVVILLYSVFRLLFCKTKKPVPVQCSTEIGSKYSCVNEGEWISNPVSAFIQFNLDELIPVNEHHTLQWVLIRYLPRGKSSVFCHFNIFATQGIHTLYVPYISAGTTFDVDFSFAKNSLKDKRISLTVESGITAYRLKERRVESRHFSRPRTNPVVKEINDPAKQTYPRIDFYDHKESDELANVDRDTVALVNNSQDMISVTLVVSNLDANSKEINHISVSYAIKPHNTANIPLQHLKMELPWYNCQTQASSQLRIIAYEYSKHEDVFPDRWSDA